jgi:hypothetical protein
VPAAGVPLSTLVAAANVTPLGSVPVLMNVVCRVTCPVTVNVTPVPTVNVAFIRTGDRRNPIYCQREVLQSIGADAVGRRETDVVGAACARRRRST